MQPIESPVEPGYEFLWEPIVNTKNYVARLTGFIGPKEWTEGDPLYINLRTPTASHVLTQAEYNVLKGEEFTWTVAATCNTLPDMDYMSRLEYPQPEVFYK